MQLSPECQALSFGPGRTIGAEVFRRSAADPPQRRYHHFHPAAELVWFRRAEAVLHLGERALPTGGGQLVYLPSMTPHDFEVAQGETEFVLVLYDPAHEGGLPGSVRAGLARGPAILAAPPDIAGRIETLAAWLVAAGAEAAPGGTQARLLELLLTLAAGGSPAGATAGGPGGPGGPGGDPLARIGRAVALVHDDPARPLALADAARACNLSPAYFARLFRAQMKTTFADYVQAHRLNLAAALVASSDLPIGQIAYRTGFASPAHLSARFSARFGQSPRRYRDAARARPLFAAAAAGGGTAGEGQGGTSLSPP